MFIFCIANFNQKTLTRPAYDQDTEPVVRLVPNKIILYKLAYILRYT
jgi:hypothetical protein